MTLKELEHLLDTKTPWELFDGDPEAKRRELLLICHPDRNLDDIEYATQLTKVVGQMFESYSIPTATIKSKQRSYSLQSTLGTGDVADVFQVQHDRDRYVAKVSRVPGGEVLLDTEQKLLTQLYAAAANDPTNDVYCHFLPQLVESFPIRDKIPKRVNVFSYEPGWVTLAYLRSRFPQGLDGRHIAWIFNRLLSVLGFVHGQGYMHGAVLPSHILIHPELHSLKLIGWGQATQDRITVVSQAYRDWYPLEVFAKQPTTPATDLYMAAACMLFLAGGEIGAAGKVTWPLTTQLPASMLRFLTTCLLPPRMRPSGAFALFDEYQSLLRDLYGKRTFHPLVMT